MLNFLRKTARRLLLSSNTTETYLKDHDDVHRYIAQHLKPIGIKGHLVNGIDGVVIPEFHADFETRVAAYDGYYDEYRVHTHNLLTALTLYSVATYALSSYRMLTSGINPIEVLIQHRNTLNYYNRRTKSC